MMMSEEESEKRPEDARGRMFGRVLCNRRVTWCVPGRTSWGGLEREIKILSSFLSVYALNLDIVYHYTFLFII